MATKTTPAEALHSIPPGISWTAPDKSRTWQQPPKFVKITDVVQQYMALLSDDKIINDVLDTLESKIPLSVIAEGLMLSGVSKGAHTVDAGILAMPVIMEVLKSIAMFNDIDVKMYASDYDEEDAASPRVVRSAVDKLFNKVKEPEQTMVEPEPPQGLMGRKSKEV